MYIIHVLNIVLLKLLSCRCFCFRPILPKDYLSIEGNLGFDVSRNDVQCTLYTVQCTVYIVQCTHLNFCSL